MQWYAKHKRVLPWRGTKNPYYIWLSEIILQQTQVKQGLPYYNAFVAAFPTVFDLANAKQDQVLKLWQGLGYYSRARNLHTTAQHIAYELNNNFPNNYNDLLKLKGVGDYTASAIASIAFNEVAAVVDGNVYRVLARYFGIKTPINSSKGIKEFKALATQLIDVKNPATYNQAVMEFGARQCKPKNPDCTVCPLNTSCVALQKKQVANLPMKLKKTKIVKKHLNFLVCIDPNKHTLLEQRKGKGIWQGLYQFPLIESTKNLNTEDFKQLNTSALNITIKDYYLYNKSVIIHKLSHQHLHTNFWVVKTKTLTSNAIPIASIHNYAVPQLMANFLNEFDFSTA